MQLYSALYLDLNGNVAVRTGNTDGTGGKDRELVVTTYFVKTAFSGASVGDTITQTQVIDVANSPSTISVIWRNQSTATDLGSVPSAANLTLDGSQAMSLAQFQSTDFAVNSTFTGGTARTKLTDGTNNVGVSDSITAASETLVDRLKVNAALRVLDTTQATGSKLVAAYGDQTSGVWVNTKASVLPTGASTESTLSAMSAKLPASLGIKTAAGSLSVALASDGTLPLPTGAATESTLSAFSTKFPSSLGAKTTAASLSVTLSSDATVPLPTGASTSALQTTGNTSLSSIDGKIVTTTVNSIIRANVVLPSNGAAGSAIPFHVDVVGGSDGTNSRALQTDTAGRAQVNPLGAPGVARQLAAGSTTANTALTTTCLRITIEARKADIRFAIGTGAQTAVNTTSHFIGLGSVRDFSVPANANIAVIRDSAATVDGILELTELV